MFKKFFSFLASIVKPKETIAIIPVVTQAPTRQEDLPANPWKIMSFVSPDDKTHAIEVTYTNEFGAPVTNTCMALFENPGEYKLVAPWLGAGKILQKANLTDLIVKTVAAPFEKL